MRVLQTLGNLLTRSPAEGQPAASALSDMEPIPLPGPWSYGIALGMHAADAEGTERSRIGELLVDFKYAGHRQLARPLGEALAGALGSRRPDVVTHTPSTRRGCSEPACELARATARALGVPCLSRFIAITRKLTAQKDLASLSEKKENMRGAFKVRRAELVRGGRVLIVDDVYDSGATLEEAWRAVSEAGASDIVVATVTKTRFQRADR
jgi:predicted amidophosphoribosyltransferase